MKKTLLSILLSSASVVTAYTQSIHEVWLDELVIQKFSEGIPGVSAKKNAGGEPITIANNAYSRGIGVQSTSVLSFYLQGNATGFTAAVGVDDLGNKTLAHHFFVLGDGKVLFESGAMKWGELPKKIQVELKGVQRMGLLVMVEDAGHTKVYSNWADAKIDMRGNTLPLTTPNVDKKYLLTPPSPKTPKINSAKVFGATPGNPFLYTIASTGARPMDFFADHLPAGLSLDRKTGIISGRVRQRDNYYVQLRAKNKFGEAKKTLLIKIGDTISLTPPMGWNGWNSWAKAIDGDKVLASANALVSKGLKDHGWNYVNIDDAWQGKRGGKFNGMLANEKFPNFKKMIDDIHAMGLKLGVYSSPWITSYAGYMGGSSNFENSDFPDSIKNNKRAYRYIGKYRFETNDALQLADWGVDFLKYDWRIEANSAQRMSAALKSSGRDIIYSLSNSAPFSNVDEWVKISNMYRTGPDIRDSWLGLYQCTFQLDKWGPYGGPGHWNDPDMMILGNVTTGTAMHPTRLTPNEQYSHISLFALLSSPLLIGCPIDQLDAFTLNLLTNDEVIAINQDPLGASARLIADEGGIQTWLKKMEDGSYAIGFFNTDNFGKSPASYFRWGTEKPKNYKIELSKLGLKGDWKVRDVWRQKNVHMVKGTFNTMIPYHGVSLYFIQPIR